MKAKIRIPTTAKAAKGKPAAKPPPPAQPSVQVERVSWKQYRKYNTGDTRISKLRGTDDVLFQFKGKGKGWRHAELVGTVTPHQAWLALKKLARDDFDVTKAKVDYELWKDPDELEVTVSSSNAAEPETTEASQNGAYSKHKDNGSHSRVLSEQGASADGINETVQDSNGSMSEQPSPCTQQADEDEDDEADVPDQSGQKKRFWQFNGSRTQPDQRDQQPSKQKASKQKDPSTQPPTEMDMSQNSLSSHSMHNAELDHEPDSQPAEEEEILLTEGGVGGPFKFSDGWTVINDSLDESFTPESDPDTPGLLHSVEDVILTRTCLKIVGGSEEVGASKGPQHSKGLGHSESSEQSEAMSVAVRPAQKKLLKGSAISVSPAGTSAADSSHTGAKQRGSNQSRVRLKVSVERFLAFWRNRIIWLCSLSATSMKSALRSTQVAFWATLYLLRRAKWAVFGQPGPPKVHASQNIAKLCSCKTEDEARGLSLKQGYDAKGRKANPLADLPRWRVEMLVGTFVLDMSLYRRALTAPSAVPDSIKASYERLEYLGDGVLEGIIRHFIYTRWPDVSEHAMCAMVQGLVSGRTLHDFARGLHMQRHLALDVSSQWEAKHLFGWADGMLADSFEALLAALFLDRGHRAANSLIMRLIKEFVDLERLPYNRDYKGILGNIMSIRKMGRPKYHSRLNGKPQANKQKYSLVPGEAAGDSQAILWEAEVRMKTGSGPSPPTLLGKAYDIHRMTAEQQAARAALQTMGLQIEELNLVEADQIRMAKLAGKMPGLDTLRESMYPRAA